MTKYSSTTKKPGQYMKSLRAHWQRERRDPKYRETRSTAVNDCWRPSNEASKADLMEYHQEEMRLRRRKQLARTSLHPHRPTFLGRYLRRNDDPAWRNKDQVVL